MIASSPKIRLNDFLGKCEIKTETELNYDNIDSSAQHKYRKLAYFR